MEGHKSLIDCGHHLSDLRLVWGHSGNMSLKTELNSFLITAGGTNLGRLKEKDLVSCHIDSDSWEGSRHPSMETGLHRAIYRSCPDAKAVIHAQPFYSTLVACTDLAIRTDCLPEAMAYLGVVGRVPYHHAGSLKLAEETSKSVRSRRIVLLNNHGVVCWGSSLNECVMMTETLEFLCRLVITAKSAEVDLKYLGKGVMDDFIKDLASRREPILP